jgi:hypothetical protein
MALNGIQRRDTIKGPPLRILSLDGGGVRGYSMLIILQELMYRTYVEIEGRPPRRDQIPKPCDVFDLIVGTGTGGLIALMLGRLRMDLETCKELYVRLTRVVFETDKTFAGIPYRSTLFKASKLEEVIKECVQEHTVFMGEGNDGAEAYLAPTSSQTQPQSRKTPRRNPSNASVLSFSAKSPGSQMTRPIWNCGLGNPEARLYDEREHRTKTAVTAIYKGTPKDGRPVLLRSYDSRKEPLVEYDCKVWEAGRATCAVGLAFKPIQVGQSIFHDDGAGTFNPSPEVLDEAVINEWPGREVGVFLSVGTGRREKSFENNQPLWYEGLLGGFAEARQRLISKIENCEVIHEYMVREHLSRRNVNIENYYRLNVEIGVGEFGMNEWHRLSEISTSTRRYLMKEREQKMVEGVSTKLAKIHRSHQRYERLARDQEIAPDSALLKDWDVVSPLAVELPAEIPQNWPPPSSASPSRQSYDSGSDRLPMNIRRTPSPLSPYSARVSSSSNLTNPTTVYHPQHRHQHRFSASDGSVSAQGSSKATTLALSPLVQELSTYPAIHSSAWLQATNGIDEKDVAPGDSQPASPYRLVQAQRIDPPPIPPKTPISSRHNDQYTMSLVGTSGIPPYPVEEDEPPPVINMARMPDYRRR